MYVQPTEIEGRAATFRLTYRNHSPAPIAVALTAQDREEGLLFRCEPAEPVIVPAGSASSVMVHVVPKVRKTVGMPHAYAIVFRALQVWPVRECNPDLVCKARFTYVPPVSMPVPAMLPAWVRRLPAWTLLLSLALLFLLLVLAAGRTLASPITRMAVTRTPAPTRAVRAVQPARLRVKPPRTGAPVAARTPPRAAPAWSVVLLNPEQVDFGKQDVNTTGPVHIIHVVNASPAPVTVIDITTKGSAARDYAERNTCVGGTIGAYKGCTISVRFAPTARGMRTADVVILDNGANGPQHVVLTGNGR